MMVYPYCEGCEDHPEWDIALGVPTVCIDCNVINVIMDDLRRYLYRNVACEHRKSSDIAWQMPDLPGWS
jgi:hypothetical protein